MESDSKLVKSTLSEVCSLVTDGTHDTPKTVSDGIPLIKAKEIVGGIIDFNDCDKVTEEEHKKIISRSKPEYGDTLFAHIGASLGEAAFINTRKKFSIKNVALFKPDPEKIDGRYLSYLVKSPQFQELAKRNRTGSAQPFLSLGHLRSHKIEYHEDLDVQKKIASILSAFDDLIENNTRRIEILEEMARRIYREWFVHFRYPGHQEDELVDSGTELGEIPEGWEVKKLKDFLKFKNGKSPETKEGEEYPVYGSNGIIGKCNEPGWEDGIIIGRVGAYCGSVEYCEGKFWGSDNTIVARTREDYNFPLFSYYKLEDLNLRRYAGGSAQPLMTQTVIKDIKTVIPSNNLLEKFNSQASDLWRFKRSLEKKNKKLKETRDLLLPKLISGDLKLECQ